MLEEEVYGDNSPIWDDDFTVPQSLTQNASRTPSPLTSLNLTDSALTSAG